MNPSPFLTFLRAKIVIWLILFACLASSLFAETIILKSGKKIEGKITLKTNKYLKMDFSGVPLTYYFDEVESIDGKKLITPASREDKTVFKEKDVYGRKSNYYLSPIGIFRIIPPEGFNEIEEDAKGVVFQDANDGSYLMIDFRPHHILTEEFDNVMFRQAFIKREENENGYLFVSCKKREISTIACWEFIWKMQMRNKKASLGVYISQQIYLNDKDIDLNIITGAKEELFNNKASIFNKALESFELRPPIKTISYSEMASSATEEYQTYLENSPDSAVAYNQRGVAYRMQGNHNDAIICFTKAIEINPQYAEAYLNRGLSYASSEIKKDEQALFDFNKSIELNPKDNFFAYSARGGIYYEKGNYRQAVLNLSHAIEVKPYDDMRVVDVHYKRGLAYAQEGNYDYAISDLNKVIAFDPKHVDAYYNLGLINDYKGDLDGAISSYSKGLEIDPNNVSIYHNRAIVYFAKKDYDKSWKDAYRAKSLGDSNPELLEKLKEVSGISN